MTIQKGFAFGPKQGPGAPTTAQNISTAGGLESQLSHDPEPAYRAAQQQAMGIAPDAGSGGMELEHTDDPREDTELETTGTVGGEEFGTVTGGTDRLVTSPSVGDTGMDGSYTKAL